MPTRILFSLALTALGASCLLGDGRGQSPQQPENQPSTGNKPVLRSKTGDVTVAVTVRDKKGAIISSLQKGDFSLTEDGRPQTIAGVTRPGNAPFRVGLVVETDHAMSPALEAERKAAQKFIDGILPAQPAEGKAADASSQGFLIHFDRQVELLEDFTDSREKLDRELDDMGASKQAQNDTQQGPETTGEDRSERQHGNRNGNQLYDAIFLASDEVMSPKQGPKALIVFSDGVDRGSKDRMNEALDAAEKAHVEIYTVYFKGEQEKQSFDSPEHGRRGGGYPGGGGGYPGGGGGYPGGGYPNGGGRRGGDRGPTENGVDGKKIMQQIAERTGGHAYDARKKEDLEPIYNLIAEELRNQYLITYTPDKPDTEGGFHKIAVKASKDEYSVTAPEGYYAPGGENSH